MKYTLAHVGLITLFILDFVLHLHMMIVCLIAVLLTRYSLKKLESWGVKVTLPIKIPLISVITVVSTIIVYIIVPILKGK